MEIIIKSDYEEVCRQAADIIIDRMKKNPRMVLGLATGGTPLGLYRRLTEEYRRGGVDFSAASTFNLDEYLGLGSENEQSYRHYMEEHFFRHINIPEENTFIPDGLAAAPDSHSLQYEQMIEARGGIDLQVLGIGRDGHIGFNEPGGSLQSRTRVVALAPETIEDNARFFDSAQDVPRFAISMGLRTITAARSCLVLASGDTKAEAVGLCIEGPVSAMVPASVLQMHPDTTVIIDEAAASGLERLSYYRWMQKAWEDRGIYV